MSQSRRLLQVRMVATLVAMALATAGFLAGIWLLFNGILDNSDSDSAAFAATLFSVLALVGIGVLEFQQLKTIERRADADQVDEAAAPELYEVTTRVASQLGVPVPTIAIADRRTPEALAVGFRPGNVQLILSQGTIEALSPGELEAVVAHELAHVRNRDAMIVTITSLPVIVADGLRSRIDAIENPRNAMIVAATFGLLSTVFWIVGRAITARLSRAREVAADRAAAELVGSPATVASALETLDREIDGMPASDLREVSGVSSLSILPLEPPTGENVMLGPDGDRERSHWWLQRRLYRLERWLFDTHPPTSDRVEILAQLERDRE